MDTVTNSSHGRPAAARKRDPQRSAVTNGKLLPGIDQRSAWVRRCKDVIAATSAIRWRGQPSAAERSIIRRASVMTVELERLEVKFALDEQASPEDLDLYQRTAGNLRRLLEAVGLQRRPRDVSPPQVHEYIEAIESGAA